MHRLVFGSTAERVLYRTTRPLLVVKNTPRTRYDNVLAAVDFPPFSEQAVAVVVAMLPEAAITLYHAVEAPFEGHIRLFGVDDTRVAEYRAQAMAEAKAEMRRLLARLAVPPRAMMHRIEYGYPRAMIEAAVEGFKPDLLGLASIGAPR